MIGFVKDIVTNTLNLSGAEQISAECVLAKGATQGEGSSKKKRNKKKQGQSHEINQVNIGFILFFFFT